jgi:hypothetical protein
MGEDAKPVTKKTDFGVVLRGGFAGPEAAFLSMWTRKITDPETHEHLLVLDCEKIDLSNPHFAEVWVPYPHEHVVMHLWLPQQFILMIMDTSDEPRPIGFAATD